MLGFAAASIPGQAAPPKGGFPHATGRIAYKLSNKMMSGTSTLTWVDHGKKLRQEMTAKANANGKTINLNNWVISDGKNLYMYNPMLGKKVNRIKMTPEMQKGAGPGMPMIAAPKNLGKALGKATVAGKPCNIHAMPQMPNAKIYVWQNLPLKMEFSGAQGGMNMEATKVETGIKPAATLFKVPAGYTVEDFKLPGAIRPAARPAPKKG